MHIGWERSDIGYYYEGKGWVKNPGAMASSDAPISEAAKRALVDMELYRTPPRREDWDRWLDSMTYQQFLRERRGHRSGSAAGGGEVPESDDRGHGLRARRRCDLGLLGVELPAARRAWLHPLSQRRRRPDGLDLSRELPRRPCGHGAALPQEDPAGGAARANTAWPTSSTARCSGMQLDKANEPVRMRLSSTVVSVMHEGSPESAQGRSGHLRRAAASCTRCAPRPQSSAASSTRTATSAATSRPTIARR